MSSTNVLGPRDEQRVQELNEQIQAILKATTRILTRLALSIALVATVIVGTILLWPTYSAWMHEGGWKIALTVVFVVGSWIAAFVWLAVLVHNTVRVFVSLRAVNGLQQRVWRTIDLAYERDHPTP